MKLCKARPAHALSVRSEGERVRAILDTECTAPLAEDMCGERGALLFANARRLGIGALPEA